MAMESAPPRSTVGHIFDQPKGLYLLFTVEMWERFSFYGMRGLLVLFLTSATQKSGFGWSDARALNLYGLYVGLVYFTPALGGYLADRWLGHRKAVVAGAVFMAAGHFLMAGPAVVPWLFTHFTGLPVEDIFRNAGVELGLLSIEPAVAAGLKAQLAAVVGAEAAAGAAFDTLVWSYLFTGWSFYLAIGCLIIGNGLFKPNMSTIVGGLYDPTDPRRDSGYTIFYMGINIGAFLANLVAGTVGEIWGYHYGFTIAGIGMVAGLVCLLALQGRLLGDVGIEAPHKARLLEDRPQKLTSDEIDRLKAIFVFGIFSVVFWTGFEQAGGLMNLYTFNKVDRSLFGFTVPTTWFQSLNPMFIFLFAPLVSALWIVLGDRGRNPSTPVKFGIALVLMAAGFACMMASALEWQATGSTNMMWLVGAYFFHTMGELCISPVGLSLVNQLAPVRMASMMMGMWFLSFSAAGWLAGRVGAMAATWSEYTVFLGLALASLIAALVIFLLKGKLVAWMHLTPKP